jgi:hypothetical protein
VLGACASAQPVGVESRTPGMRIRADQPAAGVVVDGHIVRRVNGFLDVAAVETGAPARVVPAEARTVEVHWGRDRLHGGMAGVAAGVPIGLVGGMLCARFCSRTATGARVGAPVTGALLGVAVGCGAGVVLFAPERWRPVVVR